MNRPLVSIGIPAYKTKFLQNAIQSVIDQTISDWELIVVDDFSPNNVKNLVLEYQDARIHYYKNVENLGAKDPANNWNKCLEYANGEYFCLLCDDDFYEPTFLEEMLTLAATHSQCNVFRSRVKIVDGANQVIGLYPSSPSWESCEDYMWHVGHFKRNQTISEWMFRTDHISKCGGYVNFPFAWGADYASIYRFSINGGIASTTKLLVAYRENDLAISSMIGKNGIGKLYANYLCMQMSLAIIQENNYSSVLNELFIRRKKLEDRSVLSHLKLVDFLKVTQKRKDLKISLSQLFVAILWAIYLRMVKRVG